MADDLTPRNGVWHFARRVPAEFAPFDRRVIVRKSLKIRVEGDPKGRKAHRAAERVNAALESY